MVSSHAGPELVQALRDEDETDLGEIIVKVFPLRGTKQRGTSVSLSVDGTGEAALSELNPPSLHPLHAPSLERQIPDT